MSRSDRWLERGRDRAIARSAPGYGMRAVPKLDLTFLDPIMARARELPIQGLESRPGMAVIVADIKRDFLAAWGSRPNPELLTVEVRGPDAIEVGGPAEHRAVLREVLERLLRSMDAKK